jgi:glycerol-3-phosphate cytidylyltransferase-like family protein
MQKTQALAMLLTLAAGCATAGIPVGSVALYSDGDVEKLISTKGGKNLWEDDRKRRYLHADNPIQPILERSDFLSGRGYVQTVTKGHPERYRQLGVGQHLEFSLLRTYRDGKVSKREWDCQYQGATQESVLGKVRPLKHFNCERFVIHRKLHNRSFRERRLIAYSEELGMAVEVQRTTRKRTSLHKLMTLLSPGQATYKTLRKMVRQLRKGD